jgi:hypothetical protein
MKTDLSKAAFVVTYFPYGKNWPAEAPKHKFLSHGPCNAARTLSQCGIAHQSGSQLPGNVSEGAKPKPKVVHPDS